MLPGAGGGRIAHRDGLAPLQVADTVRDDAVLCPVAPADDVAGAGGGDADAWRLARARRVEIGAAIGGDGQLGGGLAGAVGVVAAKGVVFTIGAEPLAVFIALIGGDEDRGADAVAGLVARLEPAQGVEQMHSAHDVGGVGLDRLAVGQAHQGLRGQMEDDIRLGDEDALRQGVAVADVQDVMFQAFGKPKLVKERGLGVGRQGDTDDAGAEHEQPFAEPGAFEAGVAGNQYRFAMVGPGQLLVQTRHGSVPGVDEDLLGGEAMVFQQGLLKVIDHGLGTTEVKSGGRGVVAGVHDLGQVETAGADAVFLPGFQIFGIALDQKTSACGGAALGEGTIDE